MEQYINISLINDFLYSPASIYLHSIYQEFDQSLYKTISQTNGSFNPTTVDTKTYSTSKNTLQGELFFCEEYGLCGKIDIFQKATGILIERKSRIKQVHKGYIYQLYAQMIALKEQGYQVKKMFLHSLEDNIRYPISLPTQAEIKEFESVINQIKDFNPLDLLKSFHLDDKASISIYSNLSF